MKNENYHENLIGQITVSVLSILGFACIGSAAGFMLLTILTVALEKATVLLPLIGG